LWTDKRPHSTQVTSNDEGAVRGVGPSSNKNGVGTLQVASFSGAINEARGLKEDQRGLDTFKRV